ncbi:hypothetical protein PF002_g3290 [Phytophthora fragariae]|uniref:TNFR-Cys domain-containing protein n=2 Tax=Phytophthora fragariae TaxID=53985 RepID=A0A6A3HV47_9STRA|nr:hypothetical protein PF009_g27022 [Phytophthora fragariae]KAE8973561.1 hypothetical protein PF011_g25201 [Phytophthora fragariae]KAE9087771.1 hypothetical protein PF006_g25729 [Phytophthora fragariae]KAE9253502.1 hypothetical protein PF002_g3290 [Phytophthora fragariae]
MATTLHMLVLLLLSDVQAQSGSASSASEVGDVSDVSATNTTDICGQDEYSNDCWYPVSCEGCLARTGCAVEVSTGLCVSSSSSAVLNAASTRSSGASYFPSGEVEYCRATDPACFTCRRGNAPAVCLGSSDCVCVSQCERISTQATKCLPTGMGGLSSASLIAAAAVIVPLLTYLIFKGSPCSSSCSFTRWRHSKAKNRRNLPGGLKLDAWRNHLNERADPVDDQFADLELRSCFVPMNSVRRGEDGAETGGVHVEADAGDVSRAVAATDLPLSPTAHRHMTADTATEAADRGAATELV